MKVRVSVELAEKIRNANNVVVAVAEITTAMRDAPILLSLREKVNICVAVRDGELGHPVGVSETIYYQVRA
jgi:hypothetical protein